MNKAIIDSIEWHKDQLFKLLEDDDLYKMEGDIHSVKSDLDEIIEKAKKRVWVKATATKKGHYREMEVGRKVGEKEFSDSAKKIIIDGAKERMSESMKQLDSAKKHLEDLDTWKGTDEYKKMPDNEGIYRVQKETWTNELNSANKSVRESQLLIDRFR